MYIVAVTDLNGAVDVEAERLAADTGVTPYEMRITLMAGFPAVVLATPDVELARRMIERIAARGHAAVGCDERQVVDSEAMVPMRRFRFDADGIRTEELPREVLPYGDVRVILRATHRSRTDTRTMKVQRSFSPSRALLTGGLMMTSTSKREQTQSVEERENVFYVFRRSSERPWLLRQDDAKYTGLGADMQATKALNFVRTITRLRELTPSAAFDARLTSAKRIPERAIDVGVTPTGTATMSFTSGVDLLAHLLALSFAQKESAAPYRR